MSDNAETSLPSRINALESEASVVRHRLKVIEKERLPHRVTNLEGVTRDLHGDVCGIRVKVDDLDAYQRKALTEMALMVSNINVKVERQASFFNGAAWVIAPLLGIITFAVGFLAFVKV